MPYPNQFSQQYPYQYPTQVPTPMDNLSQLRAQQYQVPQMQQPPQTNQGLLWVQGEAAARSYLVAPNSTVLLMDSDNSVFYLKSADSSGMPSLRTFAYTEVTNGKQQPVDVEKRKDFVEREEFENFKNEIFEKIKPQQSTKPKKVNTDAQE